jgi:hypothetical protein
MLVLALQAPATAYAGSFKGSCEADASAAAPQCCCHDQSVPVAPEPCGCWAENETVPDAFVAPGAQRLILPGPDALAPAERFKVAAPAAAVVTAGARAQAPPPLQRSSRLAFLQRLLI